MLYLETEHNRRVNRSYVCIFLLLQISADWERASLRPSIEPSSVFKEAPQSGTYPPEGGFVNTTLVQDEESQEFDDLIFALKTGMISFKSITYYIVVLYFLNNIWHQGYSLFASAVLLIC